MNRASTAHVTAYLNYKALQPGRASTPAAAVRTDITTVCVCEARCQIAVGRESRAELIGDSPLPLYCFGWLASSTLRFASLYIFSAPLSISDQLACAFVRQSLMRAMNASPLKVLKVGAAMS